MPAWWDKISGKSKESDNSAPSSVKNRKIKKVKENETNKARSFDGALLSNSDSGNGNSSGFAGFDSSSSLDRGHPLPRPNSGLSARDLDPGHGSGSGSVSSVNSSGSSDDNHTPRSDHTAFRGHVENILSPSLRSPARGSNTSPSSPLHGRLSRISLDSPMTRRDDERSACHRLPLPPGSPTSPSLATPSPRSSAAVENSSMRCSRWRKGKLLGRGTFGHVYLGFNSQNGQMCAIKEVKVVSDDQSSKESLKQLNQEITLLSQLSHPNIVQYYGSDLSEERLSVYLEYVSGGSIHKLLQEYGSFGEPVIQNYTRQILSGLAYLHGRNTVHRDIKGANILVDPNGEIKVADFGMAKHIANCASMLSFKGSPYWMAPEVVMNTNGYSLPVDIWSLGCTVLEMATSKPPWSQYEGVAAIFKIGNSKDPPGIPGNLSADAKSFIRLCLQREPTARPTASQLLNHPFVRNQTTLRTTNVNMTREAFPRTFDGSRTPTASEMYSGRTSSPFDREEASRLTLPRTLLKARDNSRTIASLPVSPSSSPLRQDGGGAYRNYFLSPPHPSYTSIGQNNQYYSTSNHSSVSPSRPSPRSTLDPWLDIPQLRPQALVRSPAKILP